MVVSKNGLAQSNPSQAEVIGMLVIKGADGKGFCLDDPQIKVLDVINEYATIGIVEPGHLDIDGTIAGDETAYRSGDDRKKSRSRYLRIRKTLKHKTNLCL